MPLPLFRIEVRPEREHERIRVIPHGELDLATVPQLEAEIAQLRSGAFTTILLDLRQLAFMDSTGLALLLRLHEEARSGGFRFAIADREGPVRRLLEITGTGGWFRYVEDAIGSPNNSPTAPSKRRRSPSQRSSPTPSCTAGSTPTS